MTTTALPQEADSAPILTARAVPKEYMPIFEGLLNPKVTVQDFIARYFNKDLPFDKELELKRRMKLVRKAVAALEREHFNQ